MGEVKGRNVVSLQWNLMSIGDQHFVATGQKKSLQCFISHYIKGGRVHLTPKSSFPHEETL